MHLYFNAGLIKATTFGVVLLSLGVFLHSSGQTAGKRFSPTSDLLSLHYDHAPDRDDGHSAAADRTILQHQFGPAWLNQNVIAVSGEYGVNAAEFNPKSDRVMDAVWGQIAPWLDGHRNRANTLEYLFARWRDTLLAGGDVWVKEGGQSDITAEVVKQLNREYPTHLTRERIHVVQHSNWNERKTTQTALQTVLVETDYIRIWDANAYLNVEYGGSEFVEAALDHPVYSPFWKVAFDYYDPSIRLGFSDTGGLMYILRLGELDFDSFRVRFLESAP